MNDEFSETMAAGTFVLKRNPTGAWMLYVKETISGQEDDTVRMSTTSGTCAGAWRAIGVRLDRYLAGRLT